MSLQKIGKFFILEKIGQGAMGEVFRAHDTTLNRFVAIKTIAQNLAADPDLRKRFEREAQSAASLNHPNIVTVFDFGQEQNVVYMAMELLDGKDLRELIGTPAMSSLDDKLRVMDQVCDGLAFAHAKGVIHRDLKPGNIHITKSGQVKIVDFGLARLSGSDMTRSGMIMGTPHYMSPEQVRGEKVDARSDVFSLGALCYELFAGRKPFQAESMHAVMFRVLQQPPEPLAEIAPDVPAPLVAIIEKAMAKDPAERFQNASEMREAVHALRHTPTLYGATRAMSIPPTDAAEAGTVVGVDLPEVRGTAALARAVRPKSQPPSTARPVTSPTHVPEGTSPPTAGGSSGAAWVAAGVGVLLVAAIAIGAYLVFRAPDKPVADPNAPKVDALTQALADAQVQLAEKSLDGKQYNEAIRHAEQALKIDTQNSSAKRILAAAQKQLAEAAAADAAARKAIDAGDMEKAAQELARLLAIDPTHPSAAELSGKLDSRFRGQAEEARKTMARSRAAAEKGGAGSQRVFGEAVGLVQQAEALFGKGEFAGSTQKFLEARDSFDRAARAAEASRATRAPLTAAPTAAATTAAATQAPTVPPTAAPTSAPVDEEPAIRKLITEYERALETKDLGLLRTVKPNLSPAEQKGAEEAFRSIKTHEITLGNLTIQIEGREATVRASRQDRVDGKQFPARQQTFVLTKTGTGWAIRELK
jgi:serine/threonine protein kinase